MHEQETNVSAKAGHGERPGTDMDEKLDPGPLTYAASVSVKEFLALQNEKKSLLGNDSLTVAEQQRLGMMPQAIAEKQSELSQKVGELVSRMRPSPKPGRLEP